MSKIPTNDSMLKAFVKDLDGTIYSALLRERIVHISCMTMQSIKENPESWNNGFIHPRLYEELDSLIQKHLGFDEKNIHTHPVKKSK